MFSAMNMVNIIDALGEAEHAEKNALMCQLGVHGVKSFNKREL
jgi:hypothetical protein